MGWHMACNFAILLGGPTREVSSPAARVSTAAAGGMKANQSLNVNKYDSLVSLRHLQDVTKGTRGFWQHPIFVAGLFTLVIIAVLYWFLARSWAVAARDGCECQHGLRQASTRT